MYLYISGWIILFLLPFGDAIAQTDKPAESGFRAAKSWMDSVRVGTGFSAIADNVGIGLELGFFVAKSWSVDTFYAKALLPNESDSDEINLYGMGLSFVSTGFSDLKQEISLGIFLGEAIDRNPIDDSGQNSFQGYSLECSLGELGLGMRYLAVQEPVTVGEYRMKSVEIYPFIELKSW